ncbi:hypothetical protein [Xylophilus ampelinus]|uniref:Uncharacterized protein n=1 Tax=Xylophilus ampelinus TaxID=54067 RepID=A0A318SXX0_9BURK|nr:hypothetical protein [Xylophilus ampelinus]MCS4509096.1 hypothetical protein [Xylophilus ampelinus]PYE79877.1 hypothetical protein DFQ15_101198 [Xylophilus ampelinus]
MNAIKQARRFIESDPDSDGAKTLLELVLALESAGSFELGSLYKLDYPRFGLAMDILQEWRLDRYYAGKAEFFDLSMRIDRLPSGAVQPAAVLS